MTKTILITGGAGFIGTTLTTALLTSSHNIHVIDSHTHGTASLQHLIDNPSLTIHDTDIRDTEQIKGIASRADSIVHLTAISGPKKCKNNPDLARDVNVNGTISLLTASHSETPLLHISTSSIYGSQEKTCNETTSPKPQSVYAKTKLEAEQEVQQRDNSVIIRPATVYGASPRQRWDLLPNTLVKDAVSDGSISIYNPDTTRAFIHVNDLVKAIKNLLNSFNTLSHSCYNIGDPSLTMTKRELGETVASACEADLEIAETGEDGRSCALDYSRQKEEGIKCTTDLKTGIRQVQAAARYKKML